MWPRRMAKSKEENVKRIVISQRLGKQVHHNAMTLIPRSDPRYRSAAGKRLIIIYLSFLQPDHSWMVGSEGLEPPTSCL